jgi:quercetin dioxygenase-like cupin family protein
MKRKTFLFSTLAIFPFSAIAKIVPALKTRVMNGFKVAAGEARSGKHFTMKGVTHNVLDIKISSENTGGELAVFEQNGFTPNGGPPLHIHLFQDEFFYIVEGKYYFQVGEDTYQMKSGDTIFLPRTIPHAFVQLTETGKVIVSYMPAGKMEDFFKVTDSWTSPPTAKEIETAFEEHDMKVVGPPLKINGKALK